MTTLRLRAYQEEAATFLFEHDRALILAPVGAGKTCITLTAMQDMVIRGIASRFLVLAPRRVCESVWREEATKWAPALRVCAAIGTPEARRKALVSDANVVLISYDCLQWLCEQMPDLSVAFDGVVFDELTRLKNSSGKRYKALLKAIKTVDIRWGLTGSFTSNGLEDVFGQCHIVDTTLTSRSKTKFLQDYFVLLNRDYGLWEPRVGSLEKVMSQIKPSAFVLEDGGYKDQLPDLMTVIINCDFQDVRPYQEMRKDFVVKFPDATAIAQNAAVVTTKLQQMSSGFVYDSAREADPATPGKFTHTKKTHWFSTHKMDALVNLLEENQHANTIIVYNFEAEVNELKRRLRGAVTLDEPDAVKRWNDGKIENLLVHPKSAGHGLNLQHGGCKLVFFSLPWSLELYEQTLGRLHRSGQTQDVWCYVLQTTNTIDQRVWEALHNKRAISDIAIEHLK